MIKINLLPEELRPKPKKPGIDLESKETLYFFIPLVFGLLVIIHLALGGFFLLKNLQLGMLSSKWHKLDTQRNAVDNFRSESLQLSEDAKALQQITAKSIKWAPKLNKLSLSLPAGIWFRSLSLNASTLNISASVISLQKTEMALINQFIENLKKDNDFFADFTNLDLGSVEKRPVGGYEIADFTLTGILKSR